MADDVDENGDVFRRYTGQTVGCLLRTPLGIQKAYRAKQAAGDGADVCGHCEGFTHDKRSGQIRGTPTGFEMVNSRCCYAKI